MYTSEARPEVKKANPDKKGTEIMTILAAQWSSLSPEVKAKYEKRHAALKEKYTIDLEAFFAKHPEAKDEKKTRKTKAKGTTSPAEPKSAKGKGKGKADGDSIAADLEAVAKINGYQLFSIACRAKYQKMHGKKLDVRAGSTKLSEKWKELDESLRATWDRLALERSTAARKAIEKARAAAHAEIPADADVGDLTSEEEEIEADADADVDVDDADEDEDMASGSASE
jgi:hypothetical protein